MFCPYYKNKEVFDGFNEMVEAFGGRPMTEEEFRDSALRNQRTGPDFLAMESAYITYDRNGGNLLDLTPTGKPSILFLTLLDYFHGNRSYAIIAKSNVYSDEFFNWFGDWTSQTLKKYRYEIYNVPKDRYLSADELSEVRNKFNSGQDIVVYAASNDVQSLLNGIDFRKNQSLYFNIDENAFYGSYTLGYAIDYANQYANQKGQDLNKIGLVKIVINNNTGHISLQGESEVKIYRGATIKSIEQLDIDKNVRQVEIKSRKSNSVSKVVDENGEPLVVWHGSTKKFDEFKKEYARSPRKNPMFKGIDQELDKAFFFSSSKLYAEIRGNAFPVYLNIKNPFSPETISQLQKKNPDIFDDTEVDGLLFDFFDDHNGYLYEDDSKVHVGKFQMHTDSVAEAFSLDRQFGNNNVDGVIGIDVMETDHENDFAIRSSNQAKSIKNLGTWNPSDPNIYKNIVTILDLEDTEQFDEASLSMFGTDILNRLLNGEYVGSDELVRSLMQLNAFPQDLSNLARALQRHNVPVVLDNSIGDFTIAVTDFTKSGRSIIRINGDLVNQVTRGFVGETILHEIVHAVTVGAINNPVTAFLKKFVQANHKVFSLMSKAFPKNSSMFNDVELGLHALKNEKEFAAVFITNEEARNAFYNIARLLDNERNGVVQALKDFVNSIVKLFVNKDVFKSNVEKLSEYENQFIDYLTGVSTIKSDKSLKFEEAKKLYDDLDLNKLSMQSIIERVKALDDWADAVERNQMVSVSVTSPFKKKKYKTHTLDDIIGKLQIRINAIRTSNLSLSEKIRLGNATKLQLEMFTNQQVVKYTAIASCIRQMLPQVCEDVRRIKNANLNDLESYTSDDYMYDLHSNLGTYHSIAGTIIGMLNETSTVNQILLEYNKSIPKDLWLTEADINELKNSASDLASAAFEGVLVLESIRDKLAIKTLRKKGKSEGEFAEQQVEEYIQNLTENPTFDEDISWLSKHFGAMDSSSNDALRTLSSIVHRARQTADDDVLHRTLKLIKLQAALKVGESVVQLYETDERGFTTGYLLRKLNYGRFYKDYDSELVRINTLFNKVLKNLDGYLLVPDKNRVSPDIEEIIPDNMVELLGLETHEIINGKKEHIEWSVRRAWNELRNRWLYEHCNRKYNKKYYNAWNKVPQYAKEALDAINSEIFAILSQDGIMDSKGHYHYDKLSDKDWDLLEKLWILKKALRSDYDIFGNKKEEGSTPWKIAKALQLLNLDLYGSKERNVAKDKAAWQEALNEEIESCGGKEAFENWKAGKKNHGFDVKRYKKWHLRNSRLEFKKDEDTGETLLFRDIELAMLGFDIDYGAEYEELKELERSILKPYRSQNGEVIAQELPESVKNELLDIFSKLYDVRKKVLENNPALQQLAKKKSEIYEEFVEFVDTEYFKALKDQLSEIATNEDGTFDEDVYDAMLEDYGTSYFDEYTFTLDFKPYRWLQRMLAKDKDKYMEYVPGDAWIEKVDNEEFLNKDFDPNEGTSYVPKAFDNFGNRLYDNSDAFSILDPNSKKYSPTIHALYKEVKDVMHESNEMQTNRSYADDFLLPQQTGSIWKRMKRHPFWKMFVILFKYLREKFGISSNPDDFLQTGTSAALDRADSEGNTFVSMIPIRGLYADGRTFNILPQYYTRRLEDPSQISSDLVNIVSNYYKMSCYYREKLKIRDDCETLVDFLKSRGKHSVVQQFANGQLNIDFSDKSDDSRTYEAALKFLLMNMYDMRRTNGSVDLKVVQLNYAKLASTWKNWTTARNLGLNPKVALTGFMTTLGTHILNSIVGQHYGGKYATYAFAESIRRLILSCFGIRYLANAHLSNDDMMVMAEWAGISDQAERKFEGTNQNWILRAINKHSIFGFMSMADFWTKTQIMTAILMNHHYVDGKFLSQDDLRSSRYKFDSKEEFKKAMKEWKKAPNLYSLLKAEGGELTIDPKYKQAFESCQHVIKDRIQKTAEYADGMATPEQKAAISLSIIGSLILIHRQYLPLILERYWGKRVYDYDTHMYKNGTFRTLFLFVGQMMQNNLLAGIGCGVFTGFIFGGTLLAAIGAGVAVATRGYGKTKGSNKKVRDIWKEFFSTFDDEKTSRNSYANRYAMREVVILSILMQALIQPLVSYACSIADNDDDRWWVLLLAYSLRAFEWEIYTAYRTSDVISNFKSPSASISVLDGLETLAYTAMPQNNMLYDPSLTWNDLVNIINNLHSEKVKKGAYKGFYPIERDIVKLTPYHNIWEQYKNSKAKRKYLENQIMRLPRKKKQEQ